jgi:NADPH:quinone reductase-like Zn-dependent oxidoreductase
VVTNLYPPSHTINLVSGRPQDGAFALYTVVPADKAAILPANIPFTEGVVVPFALEAAVCALSVTQPGTALPNVPTPALGLPYPSLEPTPSKKTLIVYGGSSSVGSMTTQLATAAGVRVIAIASARNFDLCRRCGAAEVFDYHDAAFVEKVIEAATSSKQAGHEFVGIFDAVGTPETYANDLVMLARLGGGHLACVHPPPEDVPENVEAGMIFGVDDVAKPVWRDYVTPALRAGKLKCLPAPLVVGKGLEHIQEALKRCEAGVSATKLVVEV